MHFNCKGSLFGIDELRIYREVLEISSKILLGKLQFQSIHTSGHVLAPLVTRSTCSMNAIHAVHKYSKTLKS